MVVYRARISFPLCFWEKVKKGGAKYFFKVWPNNLLKSPEVSWSLLGHCWILLKMLSKEYISYFSFLYYCMKRNSNENCVFHSLHNSYNGWMLILLGNEKSSLFSSKADFFFIYLLIQMSWTHRKPYWPFLFCLQIHYICLYI